MVTKNKSEIKMFEIGDKVAQKTAPRMQGVVIGHSASAADQVVVEFINGNLVKVDVSKLALVEDLEMDFDKVKKEINQKLKLAADSIKEAGKMANNIGVSLGDTDYDSGYNVFDSFPDLLSAMDSNGWNTSSFNC